MAECDRSWRADFVTPEGSIIEVTTGLTDKADYSNNLREKIAWAKENEIKIYIITDITKVQDIVRTILKDIEE